MISLVKDQEEANRDFELTWTLAPGAAPQAAMFTQTRGDNEYALLMVVPPQPTPAERAQFERMPRETILIVDTSGSMEGVSMTQAKAALEMALDTLRGSDRFNVLEFNSGMRTWLPTAVPATADNIQRAREWVRKLRAGGGTNMFADAESRNCTTTDSGRAASTRFSTTDASSSAAGKEISS